jgi:hypothetical protein
MPLFRFLFLGPFLIGATVCFAAEPPKPGWEKSILRIEAESAEPQPDGGALFTGSSSIHRWLTLAEDFPSLTVYRRGFGGSQISDLISYFNRLVPAHKPRRVVVYSATNDINAGEPVEQVFADMATLCGMIEQALPEAQIYWISIAPNPARWSQRSDCETFNRWTRAYCERNGHTFVDVWTPMLGEDNQPSLPFYVEDHLHMNAAGYALWTEILQDIWNRESAREAATPSP